jgi:hypothetical protein
MKSHWMEHGDRRVFIADFRGFGMDTSGLQRECDDIRAELTSQPLKSVLSISVVEGTVGTPEILRVFKELLPHTSKYVMRRAVVGLTGPRRKFLEILDKLMGGTHFVTFDALPEALDWVIQDH